MKKIFILALAIILSVSALAGCGRNSKNENPTDEQDTKTQVSFGDDVAAIINSPEADGGVHEIMFDDVKLCVALIVPYIQQSVGSEQGWEQTVLSSGLTARDELITEAVKEAQYQYAFLADMRANGNYSEEDDKAYFEQYVENIGGEAVYDEMIAELEFSKEALRRYISYLGAYYAAASSACTDEEAEKIYNEEYVTSKHVLVLFDQNRTEEAAYESAKAIYDKAIAGENFESLINEYNEDPGQDAEAGYTFTEGTMVDEFYQGTLALEVGEISEPVKTTYGYHVIKRYDNPKKGTELYDSYIANIKNIAASEFMTEDKYNELLETYAVTVNDEIYTKIDLSGYTTEANE